MSTPGVGDTVENTAGERGIVEQWSGEQVLVRYAKNYVNWENPTVLKIIAWRKTTPEPTP